MYNLLASPPPSSQEDLGPMAAKGHSDRVGETLGLEGQAGVSAGVPDVATLVSGLLSVYVSMSMFVSMSVTVRVAAVLKAEQVSLCLCASK